MLRICLATSNEHKLREVRAVGGEFGVVVEQCPVPKIEIQSESIEEIVLKSAMLAYFYLNKPVLVEDAGLYINALGGFPGPYSSYVYKTIGINGVLKLLREIPDRRACFKSAVALVLGDVLLTATGEVCGYIANEPRGTKGFGFDPIFIPNGETRTFGEMELEEKNKYSHRATAVRRVLQKLLSLRSY